MIRITPYTDDAGVQQHEVDIRLRLPDGRKLRERRRSPVSGRANTKRWAEQRERELLTQATAPREAKLGPTVAEFEERYIDYCRAERQKHSTISFKQSAIRTWLVPHVGPVRLSQLSSADLQRIKTAMKDASRKHANNVLTTLSTMLHVAVELEEIDVVPVVIKLYKTSDTERPFYDFDQYAWLVEAAAKVDDVTQLMVLLGGDAGLRTGEMLALEQTDVDHRRGFLSIQRAEYRGVVDTPKGGRGRRVPMTQRLASALKRHRHLRGKRVLYNSTADALTHRFLGKWLSSAERKAGLHVAGNLHVLRHTFCSHLAMRGAPARAIQELAGHADLSTTLRYMHLSPSATTSAIRLLERGAGGDLATDDSKTEVNTDS